MKILNNILKHKVEILLMVVLIVSAVVFIINTKENGTKGIECGRGTPESDASSRR